MSRLELCGLLAILLLSALCSRTTGTSILVLADGMMAVPRLQYDLWGLATDPEGRMAVPTATLPRGADSVRFLAAAWATRPSGRLQC